tara:strand:- start:3436 stop:4659 length:1224 start_codon:yes stop_codon:yes gene_type:complete
MVPDGWRDVTLEDITEDSAFGPRFSSDLYSKNGNVGTIRTTDLDEEGNINYNTIPLANLPDTFEKHYLNTGDLLITRSGTCGVPCLFEKQKKPVIAGAFLIRFILKDEVEPKFIHYLLKSPEQQNKIERMASGGVQKNLTGTNLKKLDFGLPPLCEQNKIAQILSTWDKAISSTEQLVANSQQQKKALMQQLLTGKKRLPGFSGEWSDHHLTDIAKVLVSPVDKKSESDEIPVRLCNYTDVYYNANITRNLPFMEATAKQSEIDRFTLKEGDVVITKDSETPGDIAVPAYVAEDLGGVVCGYHLAIVRPKSKLADGAFLSYLFSTPQTRYYFFTLATGATRFGLSIGGINKAHFRLPPIDEQKAISSVLSTQDSEIDLLQEIIKGLKTEKQALMQQLLTGNKRVTLR